MFGHFVVAPSVLTTISASTTLLTGHENLDYVMQEKAQLFDRLQAEIGIPSLQNNST